jgi:hypothetical protein
MIAAMDIPRFRPDNIYMCKPIKNKIMSGGMFSRIIYSSDSISMNGIYIAFDLSGHICEIFPSKFKIQFAPTVGGSGSPTKSYSSSTEHTAGIIKSLCDMERSILASISIPGKTPLYKLHDQLVQNNFKFFWLSDNIFGQHATVSNTTYTNNVIKYKDVPGSCHNGRFILKISGCWTTPVSYGITYKFSRVASQGS